MRNFNNRTLKELLNTQINYKKGSIWQGVKIRKIFEFRFIKQTNKKNRDKNNVFFMKQETAIDLQTKFYFYILTKIFMVTLHLPKLQKICR